MNLVSNKQSKPAKGGLKKRAFFKNYHDYLLGQCKYELK